MANLAKPGTVATILSSTGTKIGPTGANFFIKLMSADLSFRIRTALSTGDGDPANEAVYDNDGVLTGRYVLRGGMISSNVIGLVNLYDTSKNPVVTVGFASGSGKTITIDKFYIDGINVAYRKSAVFVGVTIAGWVGGTVGEA